MSWIFAIGARLKLWAAFAGAVLIAIGVAFLRGRQAGKDIVRREQERARVKALKARKESDDAVDNLGAADLDSEYRRWLRDGDR